MVEAADAGTDASSDAQSADAPGEACPFTESAMGCFGAICVNASCCLTTTGTKCALLQCSGVPLPCLGASECAASDAGPVCCLEDITYPASSACPYVYGAVAPGGTASTCVPNGGCATSGNHNARLCRSDSDCPSGSHCNEAALSTNSTVVFGACQQ